MWTNKKVLVTGGTGLVGSHCVNALLKKNCNVKILIHNTPNFFGDDIVYFSGDGGNIPRPLLPSGKKFKSVLSLVEYLYLRIGMLDIETVSSLTGVTKSDIKDSIREVLSGYNEKSLTNKHDRFILYEKGNRWHYEGEEVEEFLIYKSTDPGVTYNDLYKTTKETTKSGV